MATAPREARHHRGFRWRGAIGVVVLVPAAIVSLFSSPLVTPDSWQHVVLRCLAWIVFLAGAGLRFWATLYLGGRKERELVVDGPYSVVRHPLYVGSLLLGLSAGLFLESPLFAAALALVFFAYAFSTIPIEESVLRSRHDAELHAYIARTSRLWPSWRSFRTKPQVQVDVHALRLEFSRALRWACIPVVAEILTFLRDQPWWPHLFRSL